MVALNPNIDGADIPQPPSQPRGVEPDNTWCSPNRILN